MSDIYLIRHGFTPANNASYNNQRGLRKIAEDREMPLEKTYGEEQARELGKYLNNIKGKAKIFVSPYKRTRQTLNIALNEMNGDYDIEVVEELHEIYSGIHYAKTKEELIEEEPAAVNFYKEFEKDNYNTKYIGGESKCDVKNRTEEICKRIIKIAKSDKYDNIFIFAHGEVNKWIYYNINQELYDYNQKNCEVILASGENKGKVVFSPKSIVPKGYYIDINKYLK